MDGPELKYYDAQGGPLVGTIRLTTSQIGKQANQSSDESAGKGTDDNQYRHAFLIKEPKKKNPNDCVRHILCAESDEERDAWVDACMFYVSTKDPNSSRQINFPRQATAPIAANMPLGVIRKPSRDRSATRDDPRMLNAMSMAQSGRRTDSPQSGSQSRSNSRNEHNPNGNPTIGMSYDQTVPGDEPIRGMASSLQTPHLGILDNGSVCRAGNHCVRKMLLSTALG